MKHHQVHPSVQEGRICEGSSPRSAANWAGPRSKMECRARYLWLQDKRERQAPNKTRNPICGQFHVRFVRVCSSIHLASKGATTRPKPPESGVGWPYSSQLPKLENLKVNHCFKPNDFGKVSSSQLHHFADASRHVYGAVTYLRVTNPEDGVHCSFVIGKSRLYLLKHLKIPCL